MERTNIRALPAAPKPKRAHRSPHGPGLFVTDLELVELFGVPEKELFQTLRKLDSNGSGFPKKQPLFGNRRYLPAVRAYLDKLYGVNMAAPQGENHERRTARH